MGKTTPTCVRHGKVKQPDPKGDRTEYIPRKGVAKTKEKIHVGYYTLVCTPKGQTKEKIHVNPHPKGGSQKRRKKYT